MRAKAVFGFGLVLALSGLSLYAQEPPAPETNWGNYNIRTEAELGWRWLALRGSRDKYRSDLNLGRGPRLFGFNLDSRSLDQTGSLFDRLHADSAGWGGDPNAWTRLRAEKNGIYKFHMSYRRFDYFNFLPEFARNQHNYDIARRTAEFGLTLLPDAPVKVRLGFLRNSSYGSSFTTFDFSRNEFLVLEPIRRENNDYHVGIDWKVRNTVFSFDQSLRTFKNDRYVFQNVPFNPGNNPGGSFLTSFDRAQPIRGSIPVEQFSVRSRFLERFDFTGRFVYSRARIRFNRREPIQAVDYTRAQLAELILSNGVSTKPNPLVDAALSYRATSRLTISDTFRYNQFGINGAAVENTTGTQTRPDGTVVPIRLEDVFSRFTGVKSAMNLVNAEYTFGPKFHIRAGLRSTHRTVTERSMDDTSFGGQVDKLNTQTGIIGVGLRPAKFLRLFADYENGTADNVFTRVSPYHVKNWRVRAQYQPTEKLSLSGSFIRRDNKVPTPFTTNRFDSNGYSIAVSWIPAARFAFNGGYNRLDIDSEANIVYFIAGQLNSGRSFYAANTHMAFGQATVGITKRFDVSLNYRMLKDTGTDRPPLGPNDFVSSFPLSFHQPSVRVSYKLRNGLRWNVGYDHFSYNEKRFNIQDYRANILYSSINWGI